MHVSCLCAPRSSTQSGISVSRKSKPFPKNALVWVSHSRVVRMDLSSLFRTRAPGTGCIDRSLLVSAGQLFCVVEITVLTFFLFSCQFLQREVQSRVDVSPDLCNDVMKMEPHLRGDEQNDEGKWIEMGLSLRVLFFYTFFILLWKECHWVGSFWFLVHTFCYAYCAWVVWSLFFSIPYTAKINWSFLLFL